ncbi:MAG: HEAT repeat domain-containing protein [Planctomycetota bacterium]
MLMRWFARAVCLLAATAAWGDLPFPEYITMTPCTLWPAGTPAAPAATITVGSAAINPAAADTGPGWVITPQGGTARVRLTLTGEPGFPPAWSREGFLDTVTILCRPPAPAGTPVGFELSLDNGAAVTLTPAWPADAGWTPVVFDITDMGRPAGLTLTLTAPLAIREITTVLFRLDLAELTRMVDIGPDTWVRFIRDNDTPGMRRTMGILARVGTAEALRLVAAELGDPRGGPYAFQALLPLAAPLKDYVCDISDPARPGAAFLLAGLAAGGTELKAARFLTGRAPKAVPAAEAFAMALADLGTHAAAADYIRMLGDPVALVRLQGARALAGIHPLEALPALAALLDDPAAGAAAARAIAATGGPEAMALLLKAAADPRLTGAIPALLEPYDISGQLAAIGTLARRPEPAVRAAAAALYGQSAAYKGLAITAVTGLKQLVRDPVPLVRAAAYAACARGGADLIDTIHDGFADTEPRVIVAAVRAAGAVGNFRSLPKLLALYRKGSPLVIYAASAVLATMHATGERPGTPSLLNFRYAVPAPRPAAPPPGDLLLVRTGQCRAILLPPRPDELLADATLTAFALPGRVEPVTFGVYAAAPVTEQPITVAGFTGGGESPGLTPADITVCTATPDGAPWLFRRAALPALPAGGFQRVWLLVRVPAATPAGTCTGTVTIGTTVLIVNINILPWQIGAGAGLCGVAGNREGLSSFEQELADTGFACVFRSLPAAYQEQADGTPLLTDLTDSWPPARQTAIIDLAGPAAAGPEGAPDSYRFHIPYLHERRVLRAVLFLQSFCRERRLPPPVFTLGLAPADGATARESLHRRLINTIHTVTGAQVAAFPPGTTVTASPADLTVLEAPDLDLAAAETLHLRGAELVLASGPAWAPSDLRRRMGAHQWFTRSAGHLFRPGPRPADVPHDAVSLALVEAVEGVKDLEYLQLLEDLIARTKDRETEPGTLRRILDIESMLLSLRYALSAEYTAPVWQDLDIDLLRAFLVQSALQLHFGKKL